MSKVDDESVFADSLEELGKGCILSGHMSVDLMVISDGVLYDEQEDYKYVECCIIGPSRVRLLEGDLSFYMVKGNSIFIGYK